MAPKPHLVLAFFDSEAEADGAAAALSAWAKSNRRVHLDAVGILVKDEQGTIKTHKLGPREGKKGLGIGGILGAVAAVASGGITLLEGVVVGVAGGGVLGSLFHKSLGVSKADVARIGAELDAGRAAVGALVPENQAPAIAEELEALGGESEVHQVSPEEVAEVTETVVATM